MPRNARNPDREERADGDVNDVLYERAYETKRATEKQRLSADKYPPITGLIILKLIGNIYFLENRKNAAK